MQNNKVQRVATSTPFRTTCYSKCLRRIRVSVLLSHMKDFLDTSGLPLQVHSGLFFRSNVEFDTAFVNSNKSTYKSKFTAIAYWVELTLCVHTFHASGLVFNFWWYQHRWKSLKGLQNHKFGCYDISQLNSWFPIHVQDIKNRVFTADRHTLNTGADFESNTVQGNTDSFFIWC